MIGRREGELGMADLQTYCRYLGVPPLAIIHAVPEFIRGMSASNEGRGTMNRVALGAAVLAFSALGAQAAYGQNMSLTSADLSDGGTIKDEQVLSADFGFGCKGGRSPATTPTRRPARASGTGWS